MLLNEPRCQRLLIQPNIFKNGRREISRKKNLKVQSAQSKEEFNSTCIQHHKSMNRTMKINDEQNFRKQTNQKPNQINLKPLGWFGTGTTLEAMSDDSWWWAISDPRHQDHRSEPKTSLFSLSLSGTEQLGSFGTSLINIQLLEQTRPSNGHIVFPIFP